MTNDKLKTPQKLAMYRGKPLDDYTKEELIAIIHELGERERRKTAQHRSDLDLLK